jgi:hypothetical protein
VVDGRLWESRKLPYACIMSAGGQLVDICAAASAAASAASAAAVASVMYGVMLLAAQLHAVSAELDITLRAATDTR